MNDPQRRPIASDTISRDAIQADCTRPGCCGPVRRRDAIQFLGLGAAAFAVGRPRDAVAGPFETSDFEKLVPVDKKLNPDWLESLFERGVPTVYRGEALRRIGMPIGGLCAGQLYLGGDGKLWHWDIFNQPIGTGDGHYANPPLPASPLAQGFALRTRSAAGAQTRMLDRTGFGEVSFRGEYPIGVVEYSGSAAPVRVRLEAFSPFIPLDAADSALPLTVMQFTLTNTTSAAVECELAGWLENAVCMYTGQPQPKTTVSRRAPHVTLVEHSVAPLPAAKTEKARPDVVFDDFETPNYEKWTAAGSAFGKGPVQKTQIPDYQGDVGGRGRRVVNSHASAPGKSVEEKDKATGTLTSKPFVIERNYIVFLIGGGSHKDRTCLNLMVDGKVVASATGENDNRMKRKGFDVRPWAGKTAQLSIVDNAAEAWGNIGVDDIVFSDAPPEPEVPLERRHDFGTMALALLGDAASVEAFPRIADGAFPEAAFAAAPAGEKSTRTRPCGAIACRFALDAGRQKTVTFVVAWHFPNLSLPPLSGGRRYATRFKSAGEAVGYLAEHFDRLVGQTRLWRDTWYDSTLPYWFLDRTFANTSILATSTSHWLADGRFYGWEGVGCCPGTCAHVWHYAHAVARLFPELERAARVMGDYGAGFEPQTGQINFRAEHARYWAADGQAGCVLRAYREHQMSADDAMLRALWPRVKKSLEFLISRDAQGDGILDGPQHNTLDADWFGQVAWLSGLYLAALRAGEEMAREMGDEAFAVRCRRLFEIGRKNVDAKLYNGEYYVQLPDPAHAKTVGSYDGCEIDQVFGQSWAWQVGLGRILDAKQVHGALRSLWRYNFTPDVGPFRAVHKQGRWYAMPGEGGLLMCSWPRGGRMRVSGGFDFYFNECMNGFEYQVAWHMIAEGMVREGLAIVRMIHDRYHAARRNPWNEVECGDHYARSMASYGAFLSACGYEHHGPKRHLAFAPRMTPNDFRAAFTTAEGWGTFSQKAADGRLTAAVALRWGKLRLKTFAIELVDGRRPTSVAARLAGRSVAATLDVRGRHAHVRFDADMALSAGETLEVAIS
jgi:non-lysosomal glucosylceramidase